jgi:hypothetical protein
MSNDFWEGYVPEPDKRQQALNKMAENARELGLDYEPEQMTTTENNGGKTGWPPGLLQDDCKGLSKWLANKPDAKRRVREALAEQPAQETAPLRDAMVANLVREGIMYTFPQQPTVPDLIHHTDTSETLEYIQGWNDCRAETLKMRKP